MPTGFDIHCRTAKETIDVLSQQRVSHISFDHDLGDGNGTGYEVACWIEEQAALKTLAPITWTVHSSNSVGRANISQAMQSAQRYWVTKKLALWVQSFEDVPPEFEEVLSENFKSLLVKPVKHS
jgi:hypothetical protein